MVIAVVVMLFARTSADQVETKIMPRDLVEFAEKNGCRQVADFYDRPGMVNPPYVYGYLPGAPEKSAAFWCEQARAGERKFFLLIWLRDATTELGGCAPKIEWKNPPRGLDIYRNQRESLGDFVFLAEPHGKGSGKIRLTHNAIRSSYDGVEETFYCHEGKWLVRQRH